MNNRIYTLGLHLGQFFALAFCFENYIVPIYGYEGFTWEPNEYKLFAAVATVIVLSFVTPIKSHKPSTLFYHLALTFTIIPMAMLFYAENKPWGYAAQIITAYLATFVFYHFVYFNAPQIASVSK